jgi:hypothetical protein
MKKGNKFENRMKTGFRYLIFLTVLLFGIENAYSQVPIEVQATIALKILSYDSNFGRFGAVIKIGVSSKDLLDVFKKIVTAQPTLKDKKLDVELMSSPADVSKFKVVFIGDNWSDKYSAIGPVATSKKILAISSSEDGLKKGMAVSFKLVDSKPKILLSKGAVKNQGSSFSADLLSLAELVD